MWSLLWKSFKIIELVSSPSPWGLFPVRHGAQTGCWGQEGEIRKGSPIGPPASLLPSTVAFPLSEDSLTVVNLAGFFPSQDRLWREVGKTLVLARLTQGILRSELA